MKRKRCSTTVAKKHKTHLPCKPVEIVECGECNCHCCILHGVKRFMNIEVCDGDVKNISKRFEEDGNEKRKKKVPSKRNRKKKKSSEKEGSE